MQLTEHFTLSDFTYSSKAQEHEIDNTPSSDIIEQLKSTAAGLERLRHALLNPILISSGYRCPALNAIVGGQPTSQHMKGEAADFICPKFGTPREIAFYLSDKLGMLGVDQLIMEGTWIHASFTLQPRGQLLTLSNGKYVIGLV